MLLTCDLVRYLTNGELHGEINWQCTKVTLDSRMVKKGYLFVAYKGRNFDGHDFLNEAYTNGAVAAIVNHIPTFFCAPEGFSLIVVEDTLRALQNLARYTRQSMPQINFIGITGSVGKTTTKEMLGVVLSKYGKVYVSPGGYNNETGLPWSLVNTEESCHFAVFELAMNHSQELSALSQLLQPNIVIITNIGPAHIGNFGSLKDIAQAKAEIFKGLISNGTVILNRDCNFYEYLLSVTPKAANVITFGWNDKADVKIVKYSDYHCKENCTDNMVSSQQCEVKSYDCNCYCYNTHCSEIQVDISSDTVQSLTYNLSSTAEHIIFNSLIPVALIVTLKLDPKIGMIHLGNFVALPGRGFTHRNIKSNIGKTISVIDDAYNANPNSMACALCVLKNVSGRKVAVLGDMMELGAFSAYYHEKLTECIQDAGVSVLLTVGTEIIGTYKHIIASGYLSEEDCRNFTDVNELLKNIGQFIHDHDTVLIKGSNSMGLQGVVNFLVPSSINTT